MPDQTEALPAGWTEAPLFASETEAYQRHAECGRFLVARDCGTWSAYLAPEGVDLREATLIDKATWFYPSRAAAIAAVDAYLAGEAR